MQSAAVYLRSLSSAIGTMRLSEPTQEVLLAPIQMHQQSHDLVHRTDHFLTPIMAKVSDVPMNHANLQHIAPGVIGISHVSGVCLIACS